MAFQWVFDKAETVSMNNRAIVGQTITRNQAVRATSRGNALTRFTVTLPDGLQWDQYADEIAALDAANKFTIESVTFNNPGYTDWIHNGDIASGQSWSVICVQMPEWTIFQRNQVSWSGPFVFYESIV